MNFYKHHLGDYAKDTGHLSWMEDAAYTRLLRVYYLREKPIPLNFADVTRLVRAVTRREKEVVTLVLAEFFEQRDDGYHNKRADKEIEQYQEQASTNRRIAQARIAQRTVNEPSTKGIPSHKPLANSQNQIPEPDTRKVKSTSLLPPLGRGNGVDAHSRATRLQETALPEEWRKFCLQERTDLHPEDVFQRFRDFWIGVAGSKGTKLDWVATWRNWVRQQNTPHKPDNKSTVKTWVEQGRDIDEITGS